MFHGLYINLDRRPERRAHMEQEFRRFGLQDRYRRLLAIPDVVPVTGCYRSHMKALEEARRIGGLVHILEDDSILSSALEPFMRDRAADLLSQYDMIFLDNWVDMDRGSVSLYQTALDNGEGIVPLGAGAPRLGAASSYVVAPELVAKLHRLLRRAAADGKAVDNTYHRLVNDGEISAALVVPFLTGVDLAVGAVSDVQALISTADQRRLIALRTRFFVEPDRQAAT